MTVQLLTEHYLEFLCLKGGCTGSSESTLVKMPHCLKSHVGAHMCCLSLDIHAQLSSGSRGLNLGLSLHLLPYFSYKSLVKLCRGTG